MTAIRITTHPFEHENTAWRGQDGFHVVSSHLDQSEDGKPRIILVWEEDRSALQLQISEDRQAGGSRGLTRHLD